MKEWVEWRSLLEKSNMKQRGNKMAKYEKLVEQANHLAHDDKIDEAIQLTFISKEIESGR